MELGHVYEGCSFRRQLLVHALASVAAFNCLRPIQERSSGIDRGWGRSDYLVRVPPIAYVLFENALSLRHDATPVIAGVAPERWSEHWEGHWAEHCPASQNQRPPPIPGG